MRSPSITYRTLIKASQRLTGIIGILLLAISGLLCGFVAYCYVLRPDSYAAVTMWPPWVCCLPAAVLTPTGRSRRGRVGLVLVLVWLISAMALSEEPWSMLKSLHQGKPSSRGIRVVTLNCAGGNPKAAAEVISHAPDIVLLQESPSQKETEALGRRMFGKNAGILCGVDASILTRGHLKPIPLDRRSSLFFVAAEVNLDPGRRVYVVSTRLTPPVLRLDFWSPGCWAVQKENRILRRRQVERMTQVIYKLPERLPIVLGGDMNCPANDGALWGLKPYIADAFRDGGMGWGDTVMNEIPVCRYDQIWVSRELEAVSVTACKMRESDHRMSVADLVLRRK